MKKFLCTLALMLGVVTSVSAAKRYHCLGQGAQQDQRLGSLQNGAKLFTNYCLNCHSAAFMRFNRLKDIGLTEAADQGKPAVHHRQGR